MGGIKSKGKEGLNPLEVMGLFWIVFGIIMVVAVYAPPTLIGKLANLTAGVILLVIGLIAFFKGRGKKGSGETKEE